MSVITSNYAMFLNIPNSDKSILLKMEIDSYQRDHAEISLTYPEHVEGHGYGDYSRTEYRNLTIPLKDVLQFMKQHGSVKVMDRG